MFDHLHSVFDCGLSIYCPVVVTCVTFSLTPSSFPPPLSPPSPSVVQVVAIWDVRDASTTTPKLKALGHKDDVMTLSWNPFQVSCVCARAGSLCGTYLTLTGTVRIGVRTTFVALGGGSEC